MIDNIEEYRLRGKKLKTIKNICKLNEERKNVLVIQEAINFFDTFGFDFSVSYFYGYNLRKTGKINEAIRVFENLLKAYENDDEKKHFYINTQIELFKTYYINNDFKKAYELFNLVKFNLIERNYFGVDDYRVIIETKLGINSKTNSEEQEIIKQQLTCFIPNLSIIHIKLHTLDLEQDVVTYFNPEINIDKLFEIATNIIDSSIKLPVFSRRDNYIFSFPNIGRNGEKLLRVVTNKGTNEIITMYPTEIEKDSQIKIDYTDFINYNLYEEYLLKSETKTKRLSQIDKFKNRFHR